MKRGHSGETIANIGIDPMINRVINPNMLHPIIWRLGCSIKSINNRMKSPDVAMKNILLKTSMGFIKLILFKLNSMFWVTFCFFQVYNVN